MTRFWKISAVLCVCCTMALFSASVMAGKGNGKGGGGGGGDDGGGEDPPPANVPFQYGVEYFQVANVDFLKIYGVCEVDNGVASGTIAVGAYRPSGASNNRGFIYDHDAVLYDGENFAAPDGFYDIQTTLGLDETVWIGATGGEVSVNGILVGYVREPFGGSDTRRRAFWANLFQPGGPQLNLLDQQFSTEIAGSHNTSGDVNIHGDMLVKTFWYDNDGNYLGAEQWILNPFEVASHLTPSDVSIAVISDARLAAGVSLDVPGAVRYDYYDPPASQLFEHDTVSTPDQYDINNLGDITGVEAVQVQIRKNRYRTEYHSYRWGPTGVDWVSSGETYTDTRLNDSGDVVGGTPDSPQGYLHYALDGGDYLLRHMVADANFDQLTVDDLYVSERDANGIPCIVGRSTTTDEIIVLRPAP